MTTSTSTLGSISIASLPDAELSVLVLGHLNAAASPELWSALCTSDLRPRVTAILRGRVRDAGLQIQQRLNALSSTPRHPSSVYSQAQREYSTWLTSALKFKQLVQTRLDQVTQAERGDHAERVGASRKLYVTAAYELTRAIIAHRAACADIEPDDADLRLWSCLDTVAVSRNGGDPVPVGLAWVTE